MSECLEIAQNIANAMMPLALASLRTEADVLAHLDSIGMTTEESGYQVRANVAEYLRDIAAATRGNASRHRGAPMGKPGTDKRSEKTARIPIMYRLARVPLNSGGYDSSGTYWGLGAPLYRFGAETGKHDGHVRARSRELAKAEVLKLEANAIFFR